MDKQMWLMGAPPLLSPPPVNSRTTDTLLRSIRSRIVVSLTRTLGKLVRPHGGQAEDVYVELKRSFRALHPKHYVVDVHSATVSPLRVDFKTIVRRGNIDLCVGKVQRRTTQKGKWYEILSIILCENVLSEYYPAVVSTNHNVPFIAGGWSVSRNFVGLN